MQLRFESTESFEFGEGKKPNWVIAELAILFFLGVTTLLGRVILSRSMDLNGYVAAFSSFSANCVADGKPWFFKSDSF